MPPKAPRKRKNGFAALGSNLGSKLSKIMRPTQVAKKPELPYPRGLLKAAEARAGYVAVYVVAPREEAWPVSFGVTSDPAATYWGLQRGYWNEHSLHELQWTAGKPAAERIKRVMAKMLASRKRGFFGGWYDVNVDEAKLALIAAARQEGVALFDDVEKHRKLHKIAQHAWEAKVGVEYLPAPVVDATDERPSGIVVPLRPKGPRGRI